MISYSSYAATVTWNGGFGFWGQANRWSTGTVPGPNDYVVIQNGFVIMGQNFNATVKGIEIANNAAFRIEPDATLNLNNGDINQAALINNGITFNFGEINIDGYEGTYSNTQVGLINNNFFRNFSAGDIIIRNTNNHVLKNGIGKTFINEGYIDIDVAPDIWGSSIQSGGVFENRSSGIIDIKNGQSAILATSLGTAFKNWGKINIQDPAGAGFQCNTDCNNFLSGSIQIQNGQFENRAHFVNEGQIYVSDYNSPNQLAAVRNDNFIENYGSININNIGGPGILNDATYGTSPVIDNYGNINISNVLGKSIFNQYYIFNFNTGWIEADNYFKGGEYINYGVIKNTYNGISHSINLSNYGIFNDKYDKLNYNNVVNNGVIVRPIQGPLSSGDPVSNAFDLANSSSFTFAGNWVNNFYPGTNCGTYNSSNNTFIPNANAENDMELHAEISINSSGLGGFFDVVVLNTTNRSVHRNSDRAHLNSGESIKVYPNPASDHIQVEWGKDYNSINRIMILNSLGQVVYDQTVNGNQRQFRIDITRQMTAGMYYMQLIDTEGSLETRKLRVSN